MKVLKELSERFYSTITNKGVYAAHEYSIEKSRMNLVISILEKCRANTFLDVGCGEGIYIKKMRPYYELLIGLDFCKATLLNLKKEIEKGKNVECILGDAHKLPFKNNSIEVILTSEVLEHTKNPREVIQQISNISKKYVVITIPIEASKTSQTIVDLTTSDPKVLENQLLDTFEKTKTTHIHQFSFNSFEELLRKNSYLKILEKRGSAFTFVGSGTMRKIITAWKVLEKSWKIIEKKLLSRMLVFKTRYRIFGNEFGVFVLRHNLAEGKRK